MPKRVVYESSIMRIERYNVRVKRRSFTVERVVKGDVAVILPVMGNGKILIEKQYRAPISRYLYELPAGYINKGEASVNAANRELEEETGYIAKHLKLFATAYMQPGLTDTLHYFYIATDLVRGNTKREVDEIITLRSYTLDKLYSMIKSNKIADAKTALAVLLYREMLH